MQTELLWKANPRTREQRWWLWNHEKRPLRRCGRFSTRMQAHLKMHFWDLWVRDTCLAILRVCALLVKIWTFQRLLVKLQVGDRKITNWITWWEFFLILFVSFCSLLLKKCCSNWKEAFVARHLPYLLTCTALNDPNVGIHWVLGGSTLVWIPKKGSALEI